MTDARSEDRPPAPAPYTRRTFIRHGIRAGALLAGTGALADALAPSLAPARAARRLAGPRSSAAQPNILVIVVDQMRLPRWFGAAGYVTQLPPNLARLRQAGVSFARHYTASNDCSPARSALLTGLHTHQTGCLITGASTLQPAFGTWGSMLREQGYATYWYGKWHLTRGDHHWTKHDGARALERYGFAGGTYPSPNGAPGQGWAADGHIAGQFADWFAAAGGDGPWCTTVSFVNPHDISWWYRWSELTPPESSAPSVIPRLPPNFETPSQLHARHKPLVQRSLQETSDLSFGDVPYGGRELLPSWLPFLDLYVKLQLAVDAHIGRVLDTLVSRPEVAANTVVVFTSDHGEYGASHGLRGKGAGCYEEGINVPLIVADFRGYLAAEPTLERTQITSSVDVAPLLLTLAFGSNEWRGDHRYAHLASRLDLAAILADPAAPGRAYALHATDEDVTEFALEPYAADAPRHIIGLLTPSAKYAVYSQWRGNSIEPLRHGQEAELYDYTTPSGRLEIDNLAGRSVLDAPLREALERAVVDELRAPLPERLHEAQRHGFTDYFKIARGAALRATAHRRREFEAIMGGDLGGGLGLPRHRRR
ncbi:MAG: sulfatase-like hydrolase/transferase [Solirubrobacteraceae bacterium]|jgi:arylsulfatase A-like enzyme